jgi:hypothetical protein
MDAILSTQISIPMSQMIIVLTLITSALIFGRIKLSLFIGYCAILYWSNIWNLPLFTESSALKLSGQAFLLTGFMIIIVLFSIVSLIFHRE